MKTKIVPILFTVVAASCLTLVNAQEQYTYRFIPSLDQKAAGCGYYALANAHAVQQLFNQRKEINEANIKQLAKETLLNHFTPFYKSEYENLSVQEKSKYNNEFLHYAESKSNLLASDEAYSLADNTSTFFTMLSNPGNILDNAYSIHYIADKTQPNIIRITECLHNDTNGDFIASIKNTERAIAHFLYNLGSYESGHWVYIGIVKEAGKLPYIIHLNSTNNNSFNTSAEFKNVIQHLVNCIGNQKPLLINNDQPPIQNHEEVAIENAIKESLKALEESDFKVAQKLQEEEDRAYCEFLELEKSDAAFAYSLEQEEKNNQIAEDADFAYALSLAEEDMF